LEVEINFFPQCKNKKESIIEKIKYLGIGIPLMSFDDDLLNGDVNSDIPISP